MKTQLSEINLSLNNINTIYITINLILFSNIWFLTIKVNDYLKQQLINFSHDKNKK